MIHAPKYRQSLLYIGGGNKRQTSKTRQDTTTTCALLPCVAFVLFCFVLFAFCHENKNIFILQNSHFLVHRIACMKARSRHLFIYRIIALSTKSNRYHTFVLGMNTSFNGCLARGCYQGDTPPSLPTSHERGNPNEKRIPPPNQTHIYMYTIVQPSPRGIQL